MSGKYVALKFETSTEIKPISYEIELAFDQPLISDSKYGGKNIWYGIKEKIGGENGFNASEHLHAMIELKGYKQGSKFFIKKLKSDKFTYFVISDDGNDWKAMNDLHPNKNSSEPVNSDPVVSKKQPTDAEKLNILWTAYEANHNKNKIDDGVPF